MPKRQLTGKIISTKMQKTVVVEIETIKPHPKYKRRYRVNKKYKAHVKEGDYNVGDLVLIEECRPISKDKHFKVVKKLKSLKEEVKEEIKGE